MKIIYHILSGGMHVILFKHLKYLLGYFIQCVLVRYEDMCIYASFAHTMIPLLGKKVLSSEMNRVEYDSHVLQQITVNYMLS